MMLFFLAYLRHLQLFIISLSLSQILGINIVVTVLRWGSYNFYNCFEMLQWPKGRRVGHSFGGEKTPQVLPALGEGPPPSGWLPGEAAVGGWQPELALHWVSELLTHGPGWG